MALTLISILTLVSTAVVAAPLPQNDPGAPTPVPLPTPTCIMNLKSVAGETCDSIGQGWGMTGADILAANTFLDCANIWAGTPICIPAIVSEPISPVYVPPGCAWTYIVTHEGETCDTIGSRLGVSGAELLAANSFLNCQDMWLNTNLCIPNPGSTVPDVPDAPVIPTAPKCAR
ncbi:carbohydrate-binding module family 50 protein [Serendipita vermifera MAFF 305830]|uniref:Carbohydrate-binding module family 50 protein n=1 Tax=Serendipita vermifera MAFF 305830 TaxID=933852 RepID=A0A0C3B9F8_SERVB|nr:carbohydrate-binding module family 50 protein [Serendipita vermifera MAFF 305830]